MRMESRSRMWKLAGLVKIRKQQEMEEVTGKIVVLWKKEKKL